MKTLILYWPIISTILLFLVFAYSTIISAFSISSNPAFKKALIFGTCSLAALTFNYFWGLLLCLNATFGIRLFSPTAATALYLLEIVATFVICITVPLLVHSFLAAYKGNSAEQGAAANP